MLRLENGVIYFTPYGEEERAVGNLADGEVEAGYLSLGVHGFPLDNFPEIQTEWDKLYPNGKPMPTIECQPNPNLTDQQLSDIIKFALENNADFRALVLPIV